MSLRLFRDLAVGTQPRRRGSRLNAVLGQVSGRSFALATQVYETFAAQGVAATNATSSVAAPVQAYPMVSSKRTPMRAPRRPKAGASGGE